MGFRDTRKFAPIGNVKYLQAIKASK